jgi:ribose 1,5-bisphosphate isomerase
MKILPEVEEIANDIKSMKIRGAGRIARAAVKGLLLTAKASKAKDSAAFISEMDSAASFLLRTRCTAVSLANGIRYVMKRVLEAKASSVDELKVAAVEAANQFIENSKKAILKIGEIGSKRIRDGDTILTHCNSETAISIIKTAWMQGKSFRVYVTETRPLFQGRITMKILNAVGIPVTLIIDSAVRHFMNEVDKVIVGADAVAANGAVVNKIGTSLIALAAHEARTLFFVAAETYKFSPETMVGELVSIERRDSSEIISPRKLKEMKNVIIENPAFDVTPAEYIDLIITEKGIIPPQAAISIIQQEFGWLRPEELHRYQTYAEI